MPGFLIEITGGLLVLRALRAVAEGLEWLKRRRNPTYASYHAFLRVQRKERELEAARRAYASARQLADLQAADALKRGEG